MITLSPEQCRVIGVMLEKETTTPDQYPLSLNGITIGCNQKSNREPVMSLTESDVQNVVDELVLLNQLMVDPKASTRVNKFFHRFCDTEFGNLKFTSQQRAIICVLLLRGAQTPGELRTRTNRLADFTDVNEVEATLNQLASFQGQPLVRKLAREPGKRESRYVHLLSPVSEENSDTNISRGNIEEDSVRQVEQNETDSNSSENKTDLTQRVSELEQKVIELTEKIARLDDL